MVTIFLAWLGFNALILALLFLRARNRPHYPTHRLADRHGTPGAGVVFGAHEGRD